MRIAELDARRFRNLERVGVELAPGITVVHGPNGAGKTNLLEALYFSLTGSSCRTRRDRELVAFGADAARVEALVEREDGESRIAASVSSRGERRHESDGSPIDGSGLGERPAVSVFLPDRLELVKGPPATRRAHLDRFVVALWPARAHARRRYGRALAQRNALLGRIRAGAASAPALDAWDAELAAEALPVMGTRAEALAALAVPFSAAAEELGLGSPATVAYVPRSGATDPEELAGELRDHRDTDLRRGYTGHGPHLDEVAIELAGRSLRRFGSQGQQRTALLALLLAEREVLAGELPAPPLLLLDDVMSELDPERRTRLVTRLADSGQVLITATEAEQVPPGPRATIELSEGRLSAASVA